MNEHQILELLDFEARKECPRSPNIELLQQAVRGAFKVRETALANAQTAMEEAFRDE